MVFRFPAKVKGIFRSKISFKISVHFLLPKSFRNETSPYFCIGLFRSRAFMRKGSLGVTFFFRPYVRPSICKFWESPSSVCPVVQKWSGSGPEVRPMSVRCPSGGPEVDLMRGIYNRRALAPCDFLS